MKNKHLIYAVIFSLLLHIAVILFFAFVPPMMVPADEAGPIEVYLDEPKGGWQIADIPEPSVQEKPNSSKFLGMYNQKVQEETVAKSRPDPSQRGDKIAEKGPKKPTPSSPAEKQKSTAKKAEKSSDLAMLTPSKKFKPSQENEVASGAPSGSFAQMPEDFYPDYKFGNHTYLNVLRFPEVEYFVRLKRIFKMTWNPVPALRAESTSVHSGAVSVVLAVSVNKEGNLDELFVLKSSGLANYDNEALRTIRASSPFSSPPAKFVKADGLLRMSWTFIVYI